MGLFEKLFVQTDEATQFQEEGGNREFIEEQQDVSSYDEEINITGTMAEEIITNALASLEGIEPTIYTLRDLVSALPMGAKKEAILGVLSVTRISAESIQQDGQKRIRILESVEKKLQQAVAQDVSMFEEEIKKAENCIEDNRRKKADAEELLRNVILLKAEKMDEIKGILATIE